MIRGDLDQAAATFRRAIDVDPNWTWGYVKLGRTLAMQGKCPEAMAQVVVAELHALSTERYVDPSTCADVHAGLGETDEALRCPE